MDYAASTNTRIRILYAGGIHSDNTIRMSGSLVVTVYLENSLKHFSTL